MSFRSSRKYSHKTKTARKTEHFTNKKRLPWVITKEHMLSILHNTNDLRFAMMVFMSVFQGLRIGETIRLRWSDIDLENGELRVLDGKNPRRFKTNYGKDRIIPINSMFVPIYRKWRVMNPQEEYILPRTKSGTSTTRGIAGTYHKKLADILIKLGLNEVDFYQKDGKPRHKYHLHTFRHVCGTNLYRAGMDIYAIKEFLGHESVEDTMVYVELARDDLRLAAHKAYAYPKSHLPLPDHDVMQIAVDKESLMLEKEIIDKKLQLARFQAEAVIPVIR